LQDKFDFLQTFGFSWGPEYKRYKDGEGSKAYEAAEAASKFREDTVGDALFFSAETSKKREVAFSKKFNWKDHWSWMNPTYMQNQSFLKYYFNDWYDSLDSVSTEWGKTPNYKTKFTKKGQNDIFWYKFSHAEFFYFKRADGTFLQPEQFYSGAQWRKFYNQLHTIKAEVFRNLPTGERRALEIKQNADFRNHYVWEDPRVDYPVIQYDWLPGGFVPLGLWNNYYTYEGPNFYLSRYQSKTWYMGPSVLLYLDKYRQNYMNWKLHEW
jgi:hypothetical protein